MSSFFPTNLAQVTPELITQILRASGAISTTNVATLRAETVTGEVRFNAQIVRLWLTYDRDEAAAPHTLIWMECCSKISISISHQAYGAEQ